MNTLKLQNILKELYLVNNKLKHPYSGLYVASLGPHYSSYVWIRDVYYQAKPSLKTDPEAYVQTYRSLLDYYKGLDFKYDGKINELIKNPYHIDNIRMIHPRFYPNLTEITGDWGNQQYDTFGYFFLGIAEGTKEGLEIIRDDSDIQIINKLIQVLNKIRVWDLGDNGIWEENVEKHASSIGAVLSGLNAISEIESITIPYRLIKGCETALAKLLPFESTSKGTDLALLTLIYPFNIVDETDKQIILENVHNKLERNRGIIRYQGDKYYNNGIEAEWTFGFAYLFMAYVDDDLEKAEFYLSKMLNNISASGYVPELFYGNTDKVNDNNPLGWSVAMTILCIEKYLKIMD